MNLAQIVGPTGVIDYEKVPPGPRGVPDAPITVREWNAHFKRHTVILEGCLRFAEVSLVGQNAQAQLPAGVEPEPLD